MDDKSYTIRVPKRWVRVALIVGVTALIVAPLTAIATHSFTDVPNDHTFHGNIEWMKQSEVTRGCNPPANTRYCPEDLVTRGQMAAFIQRFAQYIDAEDGTPATAKHADNATMINGRSIGCSSNQTEYAGECWETNARPAVGNVFQASESCGADGGRLPEALELRRFSQISSITAPSLEFTSNVYFDGAYRVFRITGGSLQDSPTVVNGTFRCVFPLIETAATPASVSQANSYNEDGS